jgi:hypothetical protein
VGALAATCLKNPEAATACASENVFEIVAEAMSSDVGVAHAGVQRQACMFFRNAVVRNPELRSVALATSAEASLRLAKKNHPDIAATSPPPRFAIWDATTITRGTTPRRR